MSDTKAIERAESYRSMMGTWAFKDLNDFLKDERQKALENGIASSSLEAVQLNRGRVLQIDAIFSELDSIINPR